ncbi:hypothetical protein ONZ45_g11576 [Pleurotus djamor]|nr:hypothetical protein ONZ45_g11576 [Pleurotus djamor]
MIPELSEDDESTYLLTPSSSRCSSPNERSIKAQRRQGNLRLSEIRVAEDVFAFEGQPWMDQYHHLSPTCTVSSPPSSPSDLLLEYTRDAASYTTPSPCLKLSLNDMAYEFPPPPYFDSDNSSSSSVSPTPSPRHSGLPITPTISDDEFYVSPSLVRPLKINKLRPPKLQPQYTSFTPSLSESESELSDNEEASDWYAQELGQVFTLSSSLPCLPSSRPESMVSPLSPPSPTAARKSRKASITRPSSQLDPAYPVERFHYPRTPTKSRPPPRTPVPGDLDDETDGFVVLLSPVQTSYPSTPRGRGDCYAELDIVFDLDVQFETEMCRPMSLPLSLPGSPFDLEADISQAFEALRASSDEDVYGELVPSNVDEVTYFEPRSSWSTCSSTRSRQRRPIPVEMFIQV